jgi:ACS family sodium-dependent inorganic phosphate cotransporter-like MFS transporter 5
MSWCADKLIRNEFLSVEATRKMFNTIGHVGPALALIGLSFIQCDQTIAIFYVCLALALNAGMYSGMGVSKINNIKLLIVFCQDQL